MTTVRDLPEETLSIIFEKIPEDSNNCQRVCRAWYRAAHTMFLHDINLDGGSKIDKFIASIDRNPDPAYLKAVKSIQITNFKFGDYEPGYKLDQTKISKLFLRFPNLKEVEMYECLDFLEAFDDEICLEFLENCPKLQRFDVFSNPRNRDQLLNLVPNVRLLLTTMILDGSNALPQYENLEQYITSFPRLTTLCTLDTRLNSLRRLLPVFQRLPNLISSTMLVEGTEEEHFAERYLESRSEEERRQFVDQLSKFEYVNWASRTFCLNSIKFIAKYMTGLRSIEIRSILNRVGLNTQQSEFVNRVLDLIGNLNDSVLYLKLHPMILQRYFALAVRKIFDQQISKEQKRIFRLKISEDEDTVDEVDLNVRIQNAAFDRNILVTWSQELCLVSLTLFEEDTWFSEIDKFILCIEGRHNAGGEIETNVNVYAKLLQRMPSLEEITLDIDSSFVDGVELEDGLIPQYSNLEKLTLQATEGITIQSLLDYFGLTYVNLKHLTIFYNCGTWKEFLGEFQLELGRYELETLTVDVMPIAEESEDIMRRDEISEDTVTEDPPAGDFFVVHIECLANSRRYLYSVEFEDLSTKRIDDDYLQKYNRGKEYFLLHITVTKLRQLHLCRYRYGDIDTEEYLMNPEARMIHIIQLE